MTKCEPTLAFQTYTTQQDNTAQSRGQRRHSVRQHVHLVQA
jgi:hypothetical protein